MRVLVACEYSGVVREAFRRRGHDAWSCDLLPAEDDSDFHYRCDALEVVSWGWDLIVAHPPCTHLCTAGNGSRKDKDPRVVERAVEFARRLMLTRDAPRVCVENPVGILSSLVMPPTQVIQPYWFGDPVRKRTCLWLRGLEPLRRTREVQPWDTGWFDRGGTKIRGHLRSRTFQGVADAMASQWG